jgi:hypothetical protein
MVLVEGALRSEKEEPIKFEKQISVFGRARVVKEPRENECIFLIRKSDG